MRAQEAPLVSAHHLRVETRPAVLDQQPQVLVDDVSFDLEKGRVLGLIGESGAGKTTVGLSIMAYVRHGCRITGGQIWVNGRNILASRDADIRRLRGREVAYVAQAAAAAFNPAHRLDAQVIETTVRLNGAMPAKARAFAHELYERLGLPDPEHFGERYPHQVSGGQLQRAMIAMALIQHPDLIIFDEPTSALDVTTQIGVLAAIKDAIHFAGASALYISHDLAVVAQLADAIMVLRYGRMVEYGSTARIVHDPEADYTRRLLSARSSMRSPRLTEEAPLLTMENVDASYAPRAGFVLQDVRLAVARKRTLTLVGESGAGKSTVARVVTGLLAPLRGRVMFAGAELPARLTDRTKEQLRRLQMIYQTPDVALNPRQRLGDIIGRPLEFYFGLTGQQRDERVRQLLGQIGLDGALMNRLPGELSGGQKQRVCIARALAAEPDLIICDEVTSALDALVADEILKLLMAEQERTGVAYLFITHDIATASAISDTIAVMYQGRVVEYGPKSDVLTTPRHGYTRRLLSSVPKMEPGWLEHVLGGHDKTFSQR